MTDSQRDPFGARHTLDTRDGPVTICRLAALVDAGVPLAVGSLDRLPYTIRVLLETALRNVDGFAITEDHVRTIAGWSPDGASDAEIPFSPARVILQDFTGVPSVVDLAALRSAMKRLGGDPLRIRPQVPADLVIDHSVQVDVFGSPEALARNNEIEFARNRERYEFLHWGQRAFDDLRVVPPASGIVHQVNLEGLATVVTRRKVGSDTLAFPDTLVGTDSHTTMINGIGVLGWGVGGIEAEAVMLGQPIYMVLPRVVGVHLSGSIPEGATATDLVLLVTERLRKHGVVGKFVEFFGEGLSALPLADRATLANMAPEYGATCGFFPVDAETLNYLRRTGRDESTVDLVERYSKEQGLYRTDEAAEPRFSEIVEIDMSEAEASLAGPKRPQDRIRLRDMKAAFARDLAESFGKTGDAAGVSATVSMTGKGDATLKHGSVVIAAITSCTNTSNPSVLLAAGLLAQKAIARGLTANPAVKTSMAPGSRVVTRYLKQAGVLEALETLGFHVVGYGCTTCIGNSGPLPEPVANATREHDLIAAAVLSGNRNFEGRVNPLTRANYLASPPLVVAYAIAGTVDIDLATEPIGKDGSGNDVFLRDIWPTQAEVRTTLNDALTPEMFVAEYSHIYDANETWNAIEAGDGDLFDWDAASTYIREPEFFQGIGADVPALAPVTGARVLALLGDSITTDHISPAGAIKPDSPAGRYLQEHGVKPADFNSYGSRRGNHEVMMRGTFANIRLRNQLVPGSEGGVTKHVPSGETMAIYDAAMRYKQGSTPLVVLAGKEYGTGSSRDWAAKGSFLLGVRAVIAESYERIHRSNLVFMGVLPLQFSPGESWKSLGLTGNETFDIALNDDLTPGQSLTVTAKSDDGKTTTFTAIARADSPIEVRYLRNGGILHTVLREMAAGG